MQGVRSAQSAGVVLGVFALGRVCTDTCTGFVMPLTDTASLGLIINYTQSKKFCDLCSPEV